LTVANPVDLNAAILGLTVGSPPPPPETTYDLLIWDNTYARFRNQSFNSTIIFYEPDTNLLLFATQEGDNGYAIRYLAYQDYQDGGWQSGALVQNAIPVTIQLPYQDLGKPHFPKQWNMVEIDVNTEGQDLNITLNFDEGITPLQLPTVNNLIRQKVQLPVYHGFGQESYRCSPELQIDVLEAPIIYQLNIYAAVLAANRDTFDSYWIKYGTDESKLIKECYFDYTSQIEIEVDLYADGGTTPYYTFFLPANPLRSQVPTRVRFPALKCRLWRMIMQSVTSSMVVSSSPFQLWSAPTVRWKPCLVGNAGGYAMMDLNT
jgi:hypothetical protein